MTEAPTTQEQYTRAVQSSSLRVEAGVRGDADMLIAAGWCKSKFGGALMRLQAEWDGAERWGVKVPVRPTRRAVMAEAQVEFDKKTTKDAKGRERTVQIRKITGSSMEAARLKLEARYEAEMRKLAGALKSLPEVITMLELKLLLDGQSADRAAPLVLYWLDPVCKVCNGQKYQRIPGTVKLSERACGCCKGDGVIQPPFGDAGRAMQEFVESCVADAQSSVRKRNA